MGETMAFCESSSARPPAGSSIVVGNDGNYSWVFEYSLWRDPTVFFTILKVFGGVGLGIVAVATIFDLVDNDWDFSVLADSLRFGLVVMGVLCVLSVVGYALYALMQGGKYCVMFTMGETGIEHRVLPKTMKKAEAVAALNVLMGAASGNPSQVGIGLISGTRDTMKSDFANVRSIQGYPRRGVIKVNEPLAKNQVYVDKGDYEFVYDFICKRCPRAKIRG